MIMTAEDLRHDHNWEKFLANRKKRIEKELEVKHRKQLITSQIDFNSTIWTGQWRQKAPKTNQTLRSRAEIRVFDESSPMSYQNTPKSIPFPKKNIKVAMIGRQDNVQPISP